MENLLAIIDGQFRMLGNEYETATAKFHAARDLAWRTHTDCANVTAGQFFKWKKSQPKRTAPRRTRPAIDGDFDDMGRGAIAAQYHYDQKRKHGRL